MISINANTASSLAAYNLSGTNVNLQKNLQRLSSGSRINSSFDDAGGLAVSMKLSSAIRRTEATQANVNNAISFLQTQDGVLKNADKVVSRMSELSALAQDVTKSDQDISLYNTEFHNLKQQLVSQYQERFNGIRLFSEDEDAAGGLLSPPAPSLNYAVNDLDSETGAHISVVTSQDGSRQVSITQSALTNDPFTHMMIHGFHRFEINGETYVARQDIDPDDFNQAGTSGISVYSLSSGERFLLNNRGLPITPATQVYDPETEMFNQSFSYVVDLRNSTDGSVVDSDTVEADGYMVAPAAAGPPPVPPPHVAISHEDFLSQTSINQTAMDSGNANDYMDLSQLAIQSLATIRATNGAEQIRLIFASDMLAVNKVNLESANSRIVDVDVAVESSQLARFNILQQAGTAMLAQANITSQSILRLIA